MPGLKRSALNCLKKGIKNLTMVSHSLNSLKSFVMWRLFYRKLYYWLIMGMFKVSIDEYKMYQALDIE